MGPYCRFELASSAADGLAGVADDVLAGIERDATSADAKDLEERADAVECEGGVAVVAFADAEFAGRAEDAEVGEKHGMGR